MEFLETNTFEKDFNDIKNKIDEKNHQLNRLEIDIQELDKDSVQKQFSFLNRYIIFWKMLAKLNSAWNYQSDLSSPFLCFDLI